MILYILIGIVGLIALLLVIAAFGTKSYTVSRDITINAPVDKVYNYIRFLKNEDFYNKWVMTDPNMKKEFRNKDGEVGFVYAWDSKNKNAGKGELELKKLVVNERTECEIRFERPFAGVAQTSMALNSIDENATHVTWTMSSVMKYPMNIMLVFLNMDNMLGKDLNTSLNNLKRNLEQNG